MSKADDLTAWRYFLAFAKTGSLTAAAKMLDLEVSAVSRGIAGLERALGCELIRHNTRPLALTDAGDVAVKRMETILRAHDSLVETLMNTNRRLEGNIRLSSAPGFAARRLTPILQKFRSEHPDITVEILGGLREADVQKGLCDIATLTGEPTLPGLVYMSRGRNVYLPVASPAYILRHGLPVRPEELKNHTGYVYTGPVRPETREIVRGEEHAQVHYGTAIRSTDVLAVRQAVLDGTGVAVDLPLVQIVEDLAAGRMVPILPGWFRPPIECYNVTSRAAWHKKRIRIFFEWYSRELQQLFKSYEAAASRIVGLPPEEAPMDRQCILRT